MRLIDANALKYEISDMCRKFGGVQMLVDEAPTIDAVPVVRCKDCKFWEGRWIGYCTKCHTEMDYDSFCSYGERRSDG